MNARGIRKVLPIWAVSLLFLSYGPSLEDKMATTKTSGVEIAVAPPAIDTVIIKGMVFIPGDLHLHKGDTVIWINKDIVPHNITDFPDSKWTSGTLAMNSSWKMKVDDTFDYYCSIHPTMKGKITVDP
ncbi:hypothetical protein K8352_17370 [Flavobacteriaceae bacterium F89]|uniref:Blue (type 1) copper domain-containing protein n=1 Tax=Cerina litoralis TaxID=2874477 RepID=A0AAE3EXX1_9FLAO|nr:plastocyanin/azurin family copper-binding protein [Cerina litoralis]MCG2462535.1 hypothetical protein [Cerina litoralis]